MATAPMTQYVPGHRVIIRDLKTGDVKFDVSNDLISIATNKAYGRCAGMWQLLLTYREIDGLRYDQLIQTNDVITIELDGGKGKGLQPVMIGVVDRPSRTFNASSNIPQRHVKVCGQDLGKFLTKDIGWDISGAQVQKVQEQGEGAPSKELEANYLARVTLQAGTAKTLIEQLMQIFLKSLSSSVVPKFQFKPTTDDDWQIWDSSLQYIRNTSAWSAMERYAHKPWNMLHADTLDLETFQVILERNPINDQGMLDRPEAATHEIGDEDITQEDVGISDHERINLLCYWPSMYRVSGDSTIETVMANKDLTWFDEEEIKLHGYCARIIEDNFNPPDVRTPNDENGYDKLVGGAVTRAETYWNWYSMNHELESGTFAIHSNPSIKAGDVLLVRQGTTSIRTEYLIEQVGHTHTVWPRVTAITMLHVTRGQNRA
jgi:hypothetical protein